MIGTTKQHEPRICQGDILSDVHYIEDVTTDGEWIDVKRILFPYVIVLTQDCDLQQDHGTRWPAGKAPTTQDKKLISALLAPLYNAEHVFAGEHLSELKMTMQTINKGKHPGKTLVQNSTPRYHFLEFDAGVEIVNSVIDFKHYFSVNIERLTRHKEKHFVCKVDALYREDISQRFAAFLSRIGLPNPHDAEQAA
ncbi:MAG TPA: hypothetical protein VNH11_17695 [Pirellulales bacterium]|nr:hypothetical protein [Pirellulales bacterium]